MHSQQNKISLEGGIKAAFGEIVDNFKSIGTELKHSTKTLNEKKEHINELCLNLISWLKDEDKKHPKLTMKLNEDILEYAENNNVWVYYILLNDHYYNSLIKELKDNDILEVESVYELESDKIGQTIRGIVYKKRLKDLIVIVEKYRARSNAVFETLDKRENNISEVPLKAILIGFENLNKIIKLMVNHST